MTNEEIVRILEENKRLILEENRQLPMDVLRLAEIVKMLSHRVDALESRLEAAGVAAQQARDELFTMFTYAGGNLGPRDLVPAIEKIAIAVVMAGKP